MNDFDDVVFFSPGSVIRRSMGILTAELPLFLTLTTLVFAPFIGLELLAGQSESEAAETFLLFSSHIISFIAQPLATAALIHGVFRRLRGERASLGDSLQVGLSRLVPILLYSLLHTIIFVMGWVLCFIPGIAMLCVMYVGLPAVVVENRGPIEAIRRSDALTDGFRWGIFGLLVVVGLGQIILGGGLGVVTGLFDVSDFSDPDYLTSNAFTMKMLVFQLGSYLIKIAMTALSGVFVAVAYHDLRVSRDGIDSSDLVSVFD